MGKNKTRTWNVYVNDNVNLSSFTTLFIQVPQKWLRLSERRAKLA